MAQLRVLRYPVALSLCTTMVTFAFGVCAVLAFQKTGSGESWLAIWQRWDAFSFLDLAQHGYPHGGDEREYLIVWLPVFPMAVRITHLLIPNWPAAAIVLSNVCCAAALSYLFLLVRMEYNTSLARRAVLFCAIFPTAYFLHVGYSEAIFLFLSVAAFYHARRSDWFACGAFGMLATGTRFPGIAILPPLVLEYLQQRDFHWRAIRWDITFLALVPLGAVVYLWINFYYFGDALHFLAAERRVWSAFLRWPFPSVVGNWYGIRHSAADARLLQYGGPFVAFFIATAALVAAPFCLRPCYALYLGLSWVTIFCSNFPISSPRYILPVFPIFMLMARASRKQWLRDAIIFLSSLFYAICAMHFVRGWWAF
jgi:Mannosyltransferase (PIG-V)